MLEVIGSLAAVFAVGWGASASVGTPWVTWLTVIAGAGLAWFRLKPRAYGLMLLGVPGALGLMVTPGGLTQRAIGGLALIVGYWAAWSALQSRAEETRFGWWPAIILAVWQPTAWAVIGMAFLAASSSRAWRGGLAPARGAHIPGTSRASWAVVAAGVLAAALIAWPLPRPGNLGFQDATIVIPRFEIPASPTSPPPPIFSGSGSSILLTLPRPSAWWWFAVFAVCALWFARRGQGTLRAWRAGKIKVRKRKLALDLGLPLAILTSLLMAFVFSALPGPVGQVRTLEMSVLPGPIFGLVIALGLVGLAWRVWTLLRALLERVGWRATEPISLPAGRTNHLDLPADRVRAAYARWLAHLRDLELPRAPWETPFEFSRRVSVHHSPMRDDTRAITEAYERVRYGGAPSDLEVKAVEEAVARWLEVEPVAPDETEALGVA